MENFVNTYLSFKKYLLVNVNKTNGNVQFYDNQSNSWHESAFSLKLPNEQSYFQVELLDNESSMLYAFGGWDENRNAINRVWRYDLSQSSSQWTAMTPMKQCRVSFSSVVLNGTLYAFGGFCKNIVLSSCERYDCQQNVWLTIAPMNIARAYASAAVHNGCIYIAGGEKERSVEKYNPQSNTWTQVATMSTAREDFALTSFAGRLWAIGGWIGHLSVSTVESYDLVSDTWRDEAQLNLQRFKHAAIEFNGQLYVVGGFLIKTVEKYVPGKGWIKSGELQNKNFDSKLITVSEAYSTLFTTNYLSYEKIKNIVNSVINHDDQNKPMTCDDCLDSSTSSCITKVDLQKIEHHHHNITFINFDSSSLKNVILNQNSNANFRDVDLQINKNATDKKFK